MEAHLKIFFCDTSNLQTNTFKLKEPLKTPIYTYESDDYKKHQNSHLFLKILRAVLHIIIFPISIYSLIHSYIGRKINIASSYSLWKGSGSDKMILKIKEKLGINLKRVTFNVNGKKIDAVIGTSEKTVSNGRWLVRSLENAASYEKMLFSKKKENHKNMVLDCFTDPFFEFFLKKTNSNFIIFNNPGVNCSEGPLSKKLIKNITFAITKFLEEDIKAKEIIHFGGSLGGIFQTVGLSSYKFKDNVQHLCIFLHTAASMGSAGISIVQRIPLISQLTYFFLWIFGWNIDVSKGFEKLKCPAICVQNGDSTSDNVFYKKDNLQHSLVGKKTKEEWKKENKHFIRTICFHGNYFDNPSSLFSAVPEKNYKHKSLTLMVKLVNEILEDSSKQP